MHQKGLTIIQLMLILLVLGLLGSYLVDKLVAKRCADDPARNGCKPAAGSTK